MISWKIHEYVEIYKKQSQRKVERNILVVVNTPARTDRSDGRYLQNDTETRGGSRKNNDRFSKQRKSFYGGPGACLPGNFLDFNSLKSPFPCF